MAHDIGNLRSVEQRSDARHQVLAERGRRAEHMREIGGELGHLRRERRGQRVFVHGVVDLDDARHTGELRRLRRDRRTGRGEYRDCDFAAGKRRGGLHAFRRGCIELAARVLGDDQDLRHTSPRLCNSANNSAASLTMMPRCRPAGGSVRLHLGSRRPGAAKLGQRNGGERLGLGFHDLRQLHEARLVEPQIGGDDRGQVDLEGLEAGVDFARDLRRRLGELEL